MAILGFMEAVHVSIRQGAIHNAGSWLYVWIPTGGTEVVYVGGTGLPPLIRAWLHLHGENPAVARVAHRYPAALSESLEVLAFRLPDEIDRPSAKAELIQQLHSRRLLRENYVGDPPSETDSLDTVRRAVGAMVAHVLGTLGV